MAYDNLTVAAENVTNLPIRKSQEIEQVNKHTKTVAPLGTGNERQNHLSTRSQKLPENQQRNLKPIESTNLTRMVKPRTPTHRETHEAPAGTEKTNRRVCNKNRGRTRQRERSSSSNSKRRKLPDLKRATPDLNFKQKLIHYDTTAEKRRGQRRDWEKHIDTQEDERRIRRPHEAAAAEKEAEIRVFSHLSLI